MSKKIKPKQILITTPFLNYYRVHYPESFDYFLDRYSYQIIEGNGIEFHDVCLDDENFIEEIQKEFIKNGYQD